ncbi:MAG: MerR family transcriptional regulator [Candidatus Tectimicrobiota bacterium]
MAVYRIKAVSRMLGIRPELLRMWEKRYPLFKPQRAGNRYREFDEEDVQLLRYICAQIAAGRSIGELAAEGREALLQRLAPPPEVPEQQAPATRLLEALLAAAQDLDSARLAAYLTEGTVLYAFATFLDIVVRPFLQRLGALWAAGNLSTASEHLVTVMLRQRLLAMLQATVPQAAAPVLLCACPAGEQHELGLLTFAYTMQQAGWQICYLGPDVPLPDLLYACQRLQPALVALSLTSVASPAALQTLLESLDRLCAQTYPTWVGGQGLPAETLGEYAHGLQCFPTVSAAQLASQRLLRPT